jgi:hypothetical protein
MRLELIPVILGLVVALVGVGLLADAWLADTALVPRERRRRVRAERHRGGEAVVGVGTLCMAAALIGRDSWRFGNLAVLTGAALLLTGAFLNRRYLRELLTFRGPARRSDAPERPASSASTPPAEAPPPERGAGSGSEVGPDVRQRLRIR